MFKDDVGMCLLRCVARFWLLRFTVRWIVWQIVIAISLVPVFGTL
jgi:hypothetical protein